MSDYVIYLSIYQYISFVKWSKYIENTYWQLKWKEETEYNAVNMN